MQDNIQELQGYSGQSMYSTNPVSGGRLPFGIGSLLMMLFGNKVWPLANPNSPQSLYDGVWQRSHDMRMMQMARTTASNWFPLNNMGGVNQNSIIGNIATSMISQPDGIAARIMNPLLGGNPIEAQMASLASLQGISASGLGTTRGTSMNELNRAREEFDSVFYNQTNKPINQKKALEYRKRIEASVRGAGLDVSGAEMQDLFNSRNELSPGLAYQKIQSAFGTSEELRRRARSGGFDTEADLLSGLDLKTLGSTEGDTRKNIAEAFQANQKMRTQEMGTLAENMRKFDTGETALRPFVDQLTKAIQQGKGKDDLLKMFNEGIKLKSETLDRLKKDITEADAKIGKDLSTKLEAAVKTKPLMEVHDSMNAMSTLMTVQKLTKGVNYDNTLGFSYETLMGARNELLKNRLIAPTDQAQDLNSITRKVAGEGGGNIPAILDAARGLFGNGISDKELMNRFSEFVGYSDVNLMKDSDQQRVESSMRGLKSVAREANVDIGTLLNIHQSALGFASQNPNTEGLGGLEMANMITQRTEELAALGTTPNAAKHIRLQGGTANMLNKNILGTIKLAQSPMVTTFAAGHTYMSQLNDPKLLERYEQYLKGESKYQLDSLGFQDFLKANVSDPSEAFNYSYNNAQAANEAWRNPRNTNLLTNMGSAMQMKQYKAIVGNAFGGAKTSEGADALTRIDQYIANNDVQGLLQDRKLNLHGLRNITQHLVNTGAVYTEVVKKNPKVRDELAATREAVDVGATLDADIARRMGRMRAPTIQRIVQSVMSGEYSENGISQLLKDIGVTDEATEYSGILNSANSLSKLTTASSIEDIAMQAGATKDMGAKLTEFSKLANEYGISGAGMQALAKGESLDSTASNKSKIGADPAKQDRIFKLAKELSDSGLLKDYTGKFDTEAVRKHFVDTERDKLIEHGFNTREVYKKVDALYDSYADTMSKKPATQNIGKALKALSTGQGGVEGAFAVLDKAAGSQGYVDTGKDGDARFALDDTYVKLADAYYGEGKGQRTAKTKEDIQKTQSELHNAFFKNSAVGRLMETHSDVSARVEQAKKDASKEADLNKMVQDILKKLDSLPQIASAINNVSETISGKAHP